ncbi:MAG: hypothetical protein NXI23_21235 [Bacteroidetes bacterium]|jgi:hypothetical protein|nr:hypothetical protein [Bacteroidota bacterium]MDF1866491.1 hypothetical protein [Saprospiraceae bacterium]
MKSNNNNNRFDRLKNGFAFIVIGIIIFFFIAYPLVNNGGSVVEWLAGSVFVLMYLGILVFEIQRT